MMTYRINQILNLIVVSFLLAGLGISAVQAAPSDHFVTTWKTDNPGASNNSSIIVPLYGGPFDVDWDNDGTFDEFWLTGPVTHDFGVPGTYTIRIDGSYQRFLCNYTGDQEKLVSLDQWGTQAWVNMDSAFAGCSNLEIPATDTPDLSGVRNMRYMFFEAALANPDTSGWDTSSVTDMNMMFSGAASANPDTSGWDTSSVKYMISMFEGAIAANPDTSGWNTSAVTRMDYMFAGATSANPDTSGWDTSAVTSMNGMFSGATAANPDTSGWNTSAVTSMDATFEGATSANPDTSGWDTSLVISMSDMFYRATSANPDTSGWNTSSVRSMDYMFYQATAANPDTSGWNTSSVNDMRYMFSGATSANPNTSAWDTSSVRYMTSMFSGATSANPDTSGWDTSSVVDMRGMFYRATSANPDTSGWDVSGVTDMRLMFYRVTLSQPNYEALLTNWNAQALQPGLTFDGGNSTYCSTAAANARANMINADGWTISDGGQDCTGQTSPPTVVSSAASNISATAASLNGTADPNGASTSAWFQWGTSTAYGNTTAGTSVGSGTSPVSYSANLSALQCGTGPPTVRAAALLPVPVRRRRPPWRPARPAASVKRRRG